MDDLFSLVERPSRYLGNELNAITKDPAQVEFTVALTYPDLYEIGMSNTGLHILYYLLNEDPQVAAERAYLPESDMEALLRERGRPLCTLENQIPLGEVDVIGIQLPHELAYANIVKLIRLAQIPLWAKDRGEDVPLVVGGGPGAFGCEPVAPFYDVVVLGDGEEAFPELIRVVREGRAEGLSRREILGRLAQGTGFYVPIFYEPVYGEDGLLTVTRPTESGAPVSVRKALVEDLETAYYPDKAIVPYAYTVHSRVGVEVMRGCTVGCRFCQAGMIYRPLRERSPKRILDLAKCGLNSTGFDEVSLLSLDTGDYTLIDPLTKELLDQTEDKRIGLSLPSLRAGSLTDEVIRDIRRVRRTSFTIAPEAGTQRLRDVINKNISDEEIFETVERVAKNGWTALKLYFMVGFPTETREDLDGLVDLVLRCRELGRRFVKSFNCMVSIGTLVPKPWTPFQWDRQLGQAEARERMGYLAHALRTRGVGCKYHDPESSWLEGVLTRADRRMAPVIADVEARGGGYESWQGRLKLDLWREVFAEHGIDAESHLRQRDYEEALPWDHLSPRVTRKYLLNDRKKVDRLESPTTFDCRDDLCSGCAVCFTDDIRNRLAKYGDDPLGNGKRLPVALTSRVAIGHGVSRQLEKELSGKEQVRDQAAKAGADAVAAKLRRRRPKSPGKRRWAVTPGAPGTLGPATAFLPESIADEAAREDAPLPVGFDAEEAAPQTEASPPGANPAFELPGISSGSDKPPTLHYRLIYTREGPLRWLAHREVMRAFYRLLHRSELPLAFTHGFNPKPKVAFGPPLPVGAESHHEELDIHLCEERDPAEVLAELRAVMPVEQGLVPLRVVRAFGEKSAHSMRWGARWSVRLDTLGLDEAAAGAAVAAWEARETFPVEVVRPKKKPRSVDLKQLIEHPRVEGGSFSFDLHQDSRAASAKASEVVAAMLDLPLETVRQAGRFLLTQALMRQDEVVPSP